YADGIDLDCCRRVRIMNCDVESDDDALCLKTSLICGEARPTEDVLITNCRLCSMSNCFKLGTESTGDFRQIVLSDCVFSRRPTGPARIGLRLAAEGGGLAIETVDGGTIEGVGISNVVMTDVPAPLFVRLGKRGRQQLEPAAGHLRNVAISGIVATGATGTSSITGIPDRPVEGVTLENVPITAAGGASDTGHPDVPESEAAAPATPTSPPPP